MATATAMEPWHTAHLLSLGLWGGLVAAEGVVELTPRTDEQLRFAATLHYWMDVLVELPLLAAVIVTGAVLTAAAWPLSPLHWVKVAAGLAAVGANLWCVAHVIARRRRLGELEQVRRHGKRVRMTAAVGIPLGAVALVLGLSYFAR
jgi:hypothetical protein